MSMEVIVKRYCYICKEITKWIIRPNGKYWEIHTCTRCNNTLEYKTQ